MYRKDSGEWLKHIDFILWDMLCLQAAFILAYLFCVPVSGNQLYCPGAVEAQPSPEKEGQRKAVQETTLFHGESCFPSAE